MATLDDIKGTQPLNEASTPTFSGITATDTFTVDGLSSPNILIDDIKDDGVLSSPSGTALLTDLAIKTYADTLNSPASVHISSDGSDHTFIDQSVTSGSAPTFTADNFSDGGGNAIITTTQETNFESAFTHVSSTGADHTYINQDVTTTASPSFVDLTTTGFKNGSVTRSISANGTTVAAATLLTAEINEVTVVDASNDGVKLPLAVAGRRVYVKNLDAASPSVTLKVYANDTPSPDDTIDGVASVNIAVGSGQWFVALDNSGWITE
jgi:hypothetical protein